MNQTWRELNLFLSRFLSPAVRYILLINVGVFLFFVIFAAFFRKLGPEIYVYLAQVPHLAVLKGFVWQFVTYMFLHALNNPLHLIFNMLVLWFFAPRLEYLWGTRRFWRFYLIVGVGAGLFHTVVAFLTGNTYVPLVGASGAIYGIMLAYALFWPDDTVLLYFAIPVKIKYLMIILGVITFLNSVSGPATGGGISHITHLGGLMVAFVYLKGWKYIGKNRTGGGGGYRPGGRYYPY